MLDRLWIILLCHYMQFFRISSHLAQKTFRFPAGAGAFFSEQKRFPA